MLLTHDVTTMRAYAYARISAGLPMPGVFEVSQELPIGIAIEEILTLAECSLDGEWKGQVQILTSQVVADLTASRRRSAAFFNRNVLQPPRADVLGARSDQAVVLVLLQHVSGPARDTAAGEDRCE